MFKKCLKYDMKAFSKFWLIAAGAMLLISAICGFGLGGFVCATIQSEMNPAMSTWQGLWNIAQYFIGFASYMSVIMFMTMFAGAGSILRYVYYYLHFFTDQGYLTFTLPVKRSTHFWSKAISTLIYQVGTLLVIFASLCNVFVSGSIYCLLSPVARAAILPTLPSLFRSVLTWPHMPYLLGAIILYAVLLVADMFATTMFELLIITFSATWFRRLKIVSVLVTYYLVNNVLMVPIAYVGIYAMAFPIIMGVIGMIPLFSIPIVGWSGVYLVLLLLILIGVTFGLAMANLTLWRLERKVNLA